MSVQARYRNMLKETRWRLCWRCGRREGNCPSWWLGPFRLERAHIVNKSRVEDRRAVVIACTCCHNLLDGAKHPRHVDVFGKPIAFRRPHALWLKKALDPEYYDRAFLQAHHVGVLPRAKPPKPFDLFWITQGGQ